MLRTGNHGSQQRGTTQAEHQRPMTAGERAFQDKEQPVQL